MKKSYKILAWVAILSWSVSLKAQSTAQFVVASSGGSAQLSNGNTMFFTIGEPIIATSGTGSIQITQGLHQKFSLVTLPVTLSNFTGSNHKNYHQLRWTTTMELNNDYFLIERKVDDGVFSPLKTVYSKALNGNSSTELNYSYANYDLKNGVNYYRLKQFDKDGTWKDSKIVELKSEGLAVDQLTLYPNPARDEVKLYVKGEIGKFAKAEITTVAGQLVSEIKVSEATTPINTRNLATGTYLLKYQDGSTKTVIKFVKL